MSVEKLSDSAAVSISKMAEICLLSRSRFYELMDAGVFPKPVHLPSSKRPLFDRQLIKTCLEIRRTGMGDNGQPVVFNRKRKNGQSRRPKALDTFNDYTDLLAALKSLGLTTTSQAVEPCLRELYPEGWAEIDDGEVVRQVFLHLQSKR